METEYEALTADRQKRLKQVENSLSFWRKVTVFLMVIFIVEFVFSTRYFIDSQTEKQQLLADKEQLAAKLEKYEHNEGK